MNQKITPRKIQDLGHTFMISLPKFWVENWNLKQGNYVFMSIDDHDRLVLEVQNAETQPRT